MPAFFTQAKAFHLTSRSPRDPSRLSLNIFRLPIFALKTWIRSKHLWRTRLWKQPGGQSYCQKECSSSYANKRSTATIAAQMKFKDDVFCLLYLAQKRNWEACMLRRKTMMQTGTRSLLQTLSKTWDLFQCKFLWMISIAVVGAILLYRFVCLRRKFWQGMKTSRPQNKLHVSLTNYSLIHHMMR